MYDFPTFSSGKNFMPEAPRFVDDDVTFDNIESKLVPARFVPYLALKKATSQKPQYSLMLAL